jgi:polar amino acid transport system permease protein
MGLPMAGEAKAGDSPGARISAPRVGGGGAQANDDRFDLSQFGDSTGVTVARRLRPGRSAAVLVVLVLVSMLVNLLVTNERFEWGVVAEYFTSTAILQGLLQTLQLTALAMVVGIGLGVVLAVMRTSRSLLLSSVSGSYIWFFRGTPLLVQLIFWFNLAALLPELSLGLPYGPEFVIFDTNLLITPLAAAVLGLGLNEAAYMAEIVRSGLLSVDEGQSEAAQALGMNRRLTLMKITLPQAMRVIIPPTGSQTISMLKTTSLVSVIALPELLYSAQTIYSRTFQTIPLLVVASIWYLIVTSILSIGQSFLEKRYSRGTTRVVQRTWSERLALRRRPDDVNTLEADRA